MLRVKDGVLQKRWENCDGSVVADNRPSETAGRPCTRSTLRWCWRTLWGEKNIGAVETASVMGRRKEGRYGVVSARFVTPGRQKFDPVRKATALLQRYQVEAHAESGGGQSEPLSMHIPRHSPSMHTPRHPVCMCSHRLLYYFTKWLEAYTILNHEAAMVARVLVDEFFARFGVPQ